MGGPPPFLLVSCARIELSSVSFRVELRNWQACFCLHRTQICARTPAEPSNGHKSSNNDEEEHFFAAIGTAGGATSRALGVEHDRVVPRKKKVWDVLPESAVDMLDHVYG